MISRKENLLVRPWEQRRFENHRKKVQSAGPAIDTRPPLPRQHVTLKLKKKQKEEERCQEIEKNNFNLLKRLSYVMRTSRVDNYWTTPQPNFLNRVSMYDTVPKFENLYTEGRQDAPKNTSTRKSRCLACTPQPLPNIPEERVPWEPQKGSVGRTRSKSVPPRQTEFVPGVPRVSKSAPKPGKVAPKMKFSAKEPQCIILSRGCLKLSVNFPSDTLVKLQEGTQEKVLVHGACNCRNVTGIAVN
ncbi:uncharacterized protein LOC123012333 isoform X2 [Tribolium madens]|uniref:uncharacterized protein LOC123012333 isoform X2 n=1 Tax=Tribolium madens TaxID=41895 RepID=UPI001CF74BDE|nr:uncharacterized protein LOC123012333 isoform X2 [Tribolium madens]